jgi:hypothetical protein
MPDVQRAGLVVLVLIVFGALALALAPSNLGAIRVGGVSVLWWYVALGGPLVGASITATALLVRRDDADERASDDASRDARGATPPATPGGRPGG